MKSPCFVVLAALLWPAAVAGQSPPAQVHVNFKEPLGPLEIDRIALGQGGCSDEPMWADRVAEIRAVRPRLIRLFVQEYFDLLPSPGHYHFETLDRAVDTIMRTGARPLFCICFKPRVLFPEINQDIVDPSDYAQWDALVASLVRRCCRRGAARSYWEVANEPDIGETGGCPYRFRTENYPRYYRHTAAAVLRADPEARVGGPALAYWRSPILPALLDSCSKNQTPLNFVSWHIYSSDPRAIRASIDGVRARLAKYPALKPETILDEWNLDLGLPPKDPRIQPCFVAETAWQMKEAGLDYSCYYHIRDYPLDDAQFARFMSPRAVVEFDTFFNHRPQTLGLFDFENHVRPAYFVFKLLARLAGRRLRLVSNHPSLHGFATHDEKTGRSAVMLWNFSNRPLELELTLDGLSHSVESIPLMLDAAAAADNENTRLSWEPSARLAAGQPAMHARLDPYGVRFWSLQ